jgi:hypothetical protein
MAEVLYLRIPDDMAAWVRGLAQGAGMSRTAVAVVLLRDQMERGAVVEVQAAGRIIRKAGKS